MTLFNHYKLNFDVTQHHKFTLTELNEMIPFEREVYVDMILEKINSEKTGNGSEISNWDS